MRFNPCKIITSLSYTQQSPNPRSYSENSVIANQLVVLLPVSYFPMLWCRPGSDGLHDSIWLIRPKCACGHQSNVAESLVMSCLYDTNTKRGFRGDATPAAQSLAFCQTRGPECWMLCGYLWPRFKNSSFDFFEGDNLMTQRATPQPGQSPACSLSTSHFCN